MAVLPPDPIYCLRCPDMGPVNSICFHQDERILAGTAKGSIFLWDLQTNRSLLHFDVGSDPITSLHHTDDYLITQEKGGSIKCWSVANTGYKLIHKMGNDHPAYCRTDFDSEQSFLVYPKSTNKIEIITTTDFQVRQTLIPDDEHPKLGHISAIKSTTIDGNHYVLAGYESGALLTWDLRSNKVVNEENYEEMITAVDYNSETNRGLCGGPLDKIGVFSFQKATFQLTKRPDIVIKNAGINCLRIRPDQKVFASAGWDGRIRIFSWKSLRPLAVLTEHKNGGVMDIAYSKGPVTMWKAPIMAAGGVDGQITLWDLYN